MKCVSGAYRGGAASAAGKDIMRVETVANSTHIANHEAYDL